MYNIAYLSLTSHVKCLHCVPVGYWLSWIFEIFVSDASYIVKNLLIDISLLVTFYIVHIVRNW